MSFHTQLHLRLDGILGIIVLKLNQEDGFVRIEGPVYGVLYLSRSITSSHHVVVSNVYGIPQFHFHSRHHHLRWEIRATSDDGQKVSLVFEGNAPLHGYCSRAGEFPEAAIHFSLTEPVQLSEEDLQMVGAALVWTVTQLNNSGEKARPASASVRHAVV